MLQLSDQVTDHRHMSYSIEQVKHEEKTSTIGVTSGCYYLEMPNNERAILDYVMKTPKIMDIKHTVVPVSGRGKGLAKIICDAAFAVCLSSGFRVFPSCTYISGGYAAICDAKFRDLIIKSDTKSSSSL